MAESREQREDRERQDFAGRVRGESGAGTGSSPAPTQAQKDADLLRRMRDRFEKGSTEGEKNLERARKDDRFVLGINQWAGAEGRQSNPDRATLTINKLPPALHNIVNKIRQHQPAPDFEPNDKAAHPEVARVLQSLWRKINHDSNGNRHRGDALEQAARGGYGYYYMDVDWAADSGFEQCIVLRGQPNRSAVVDDWSARELDFSDRRFLFLVEEITEHDFKEEHPHNTPRTGEGLGAHLMGYFKGDGENRTLARVTYWRRQLMGWREETRTVKARVPENIKWADGMGPGELQREEKRLVPVEYVHWLQTDGHQVLEDADGNRLEGFLPMSRIPWFFVPGWQVNLDGKWHVEGATHQAQGATIAYNYAASTMAEALGMAPKAQWTGDARLWQGFEAIWDNAHRSPVGRLPYNSIVHNGVLVKPEMVNPPPPPNLALAMQQAADKDLKDTTGVFGEAVGEASNDPSGYARNLRRLDVTDNHWHLIANLGMAETFEGRCFLELVPHVYGEERLLKLLGPDNRQYTQEVNEARPEGVQGAYWTTNNTRGEPVPHIDLREGRYDVHVKVGPNWATEREQTRDALDTLMQANPAAAQFVAPYYVKMLGMEDGDTIAQLIVASWPPELQQVYYSNDPSDKATVAMLKGQVTQMQPLIQQLQAQAQALTAEVDDKKRENAAKIFDTLVRGLNERLESFATISTKRMESETKLAVEEMRMRNLHAADPVQAQVAQIGAQAEQAVVGVPTPEPPELQQQRQADAAGAQGAPGAPGGAPGQPPAPGPAPGQQG